MRTPASREPSAFHLALSRAEQAVALAECQQVELQALRAQNEVLQAEMDAMRAAAQAEAAMLRGLLASSLAEAEGEIDAQLIPRDPRKSAPPATRRPPLATLQANSGEDMPHSWQESLRSVARPAGGVTAPKPRAEALPAVFGRRLRERAHQRRARADGGEPQAAPSATLSGAVAAVRFATRLRARATSEAAAAAAVSDRL
jgi:hypothetical protein